MKTTKEIAPVIKWAGGKRQLMEDIMARISLLHDTKHMTYIEPFLGGGSVFMYLASNDLFKNYIISDINSKLINVYIQIKDYPHELMHEIDIYKDNYLQLDLKGRKEYYYTIRDKFNKLSYSQKYSNNDNPHTRISCAAMFIFLNKTCFNGLYRENKKGLFNVPAGSYKNITIYNKQHILNLSHLFNSRDDNGNLKVQILCQSYQDYLSQVQQGESTLIYCDPPYRPITQGGFNTYHSSPFNDDEQRHLANFAREMTQKNVHMLLSNSDPKNLCPNDNFFDNLYQDFVIERVSAKRSINSNGNNRGQVTELLIRNFN